MKIFTLFSLVVYLIFSVNTLVSQDFVPVTTAIDDIERGKVAWGDYDGDEDLDLLVVGNAGELGADNFICKLYENTNEGFVVAEEFTGLNNSWVSWADLDDDGDLDIISTGSNEEVYAIVYQNNEGTFSEIETGLEGVEFGSIDIGDFDGDGDADIAIVGDMGYYTPVARIYQNVGFFQFVDIGADLTPLASAAVKWVDYDLDKDLDLILSGDSGSGPKTCLYKNTNGNFELIESNIKDLFAGYLDWGDYDSDGDPDLLIIGMDEYLEPVTKVYNNAGDDIFIDANAAMTGIAVGFAVWGDYDNDGDLDVLTSGKGGGCGIYQTQVYRNEGSYFTSIGGSYPGMTKACGSWGDYDNDNDLDFIVSGNYQGNPGTFLYQNISTNPNSLPTAPENLNHQIMGSDVTLTWNASTDQETSGPGLNYNIRVGSAEGLCDICSPSSNLFSGYRKVVKVGNVGSNTSWIFKNLDEGTYYWAVQSIDNANAGSPFSDEDSFSVISTGSTDLYGQNAIHVFPVPSSSDIFLTSLPENAYRCEIVDLKGNSIQEMRISNKIHQINIEDLQPGMYVLVLANKNRETIVSRQIVVQ